MVSGIRVFVMPGFCRIFLNEISLCGVQDRGSVFMHTGGILADRGLVPALFAGDYAEYDQQHN